jgi:hypothetical protein
LGFFTGLHPLWDDVFQSTLGTGLEDVLAVELPIHEHLVNVNALLG